MPDTLIDESSDPINNEVGNIYFSPGTNACSCEGNSNYICAWISATMDSDTTLFDNKIFDKCYRFFCLNKKICWTNFMGFCKKIYYGWMCF